MSNADRYLNWDILNRITDPVQFNRRTTRLCTNKSLPKKLERSIANQGIIFGSKPKKSPSLEALHGYSIRHNEEHMRRRVNEAFSLKDQDQCSQHFHQRKASFPFWQKAPRSVKQ